MIDWRKILDANGIEYVEGGKSTAKNNIYIKCILCGNADEGHHLGISVHRSDFKGWACWKNERHRGKSPIKLLMLLLNINYHQAAELIGVDHTTLYEDESMGTKLRGMLEGKIEQTPIYKTLEFPPEFFKLNSSRKNSKMFRAYLSERGFGTDKEIIDIARTYCLRYALSGVYRYRIIFPVYTELGLTTWTGRSVVPDKEPRYLSLSNDPENYTKQDNCLALDNIKNCLFNERLLSKDSRSVLLVGEGPFDALKLDWVGLKWDTRATCIFGKTPSPIQIDKLAKLGKRFEQRYMILDPDANMDRLRMSETMQSIGFKLLRLPTEKDPGAMSIPEIETFLEEKVL